MGFIFCSCIHTIFIYASYHYTITHGFTIIIIIILLLLLWFAIAATLNMHLEKRKLLIPFIEYVIWFRFNNINNFFHFFPKKAPKSDYILNIHTYVSKLIYSFLLPPLNFAQQFLFFSWSLNKIKFIRRKFVIIHFAVLFAKLSRSYKLRMNQLNYTCNFRFIFIIYAVPNLKIMPLR